MAFNNGMFGRSSQAFIPASRCAAFDRRLAAPSHLLYVKGTRLSLQLFVEFILSSFGIIVEGNSWSFTWYLRLVVYDGNSVTEIRSYMYIHLIWWFHCCWLFANI